MRNIIFGFWVLCLLPAMMQAQVHIQTTIPSVGLVQKNQLWNLVMVNGTGSVLQGRLELILYDRTTAQELITATTGMFTLPNGSAMLNVSMLNPVQYNYLGMEPDRNLNALLPSGSYTACYSYIRNPGNKRELLAEECVSFDTEPVSPPMLTFPADSALLDVQPAQFSWTPPAPVGMISNLRYEIVLAEVLPGQKAAEAVAENLPHYSSLLPPANFMNYPSSNPSLEKDKWYAWQVVARDNSNYAGKSEVWVFKIANKAPEKPELSGRPYIQLKKNGAEKTITEKGTLRFYYFNQLQEKEVRVVVADVSESRDGESYNSILPLVPGDNYIQRDISKFIRLQPDHVYRLSLINAAGESWSVLFSLVKNETEKKTE